ncbi:MAG: SGNH/GDSL hydrolase family protein [Clostridia bacterium]|nr:SGNH/GDSL hydrolase family protein [Clostridia bacterium]MBR7112012.1 SGNH/GDSL hydrolase family protein [Clostridia bacterium]
MNLTNKTVCFLGDSITKGTGASAKEHCYVSLFAAAHPEATVYNFGIGGTRIAKQTVPSTNPNWDLDFIDRVAQFPATADLICVFGGTNDFGHGDAPMGKLGDTDPHTFYGALHTLSTSLINKYPEARIVFFTPLHRDHKVHIAVRDDGEWTLDDYVRAIKENAAYFALPVLDLNAISGIQPHVPILKERYTKDGLHPNDAGYERLFRIVNRFIENLQ